MKKIIVVDASFILKSLLSEKQVVVKKFKGVFGRNTYKVYSIDLLVLEVANGLKYTLKNQKEAGEVFDKFSEIPFEIFQLKPSQVKEILKIACELGTTVYDTSYHYLAMMLHGDLITCDKEYFEKAKKLGSIELVG